jgi:hypothetical protein
MLPPERSGEMAASPIVRVLCVSGFGSPMDSTGVLKSDPNGVAGRGAYGGAKKKLIATPTHSKFPAIPSKQSASQNLIATPTAIFCSTPFTSQNRCRLAPLLLTIRRSSPNESGGADAPRGLALSRLFASSNVISQLTVAPSHCNSNRNSAKTGIAVTPTKQTAVVLSNRYKKPPPPGSG